MSLIQYALIERCKGYIRPHIINIIPDNVVYAGTFCYVGKVATSTIALEVIHLCLFVCPPVCLSVIVSV